MLNSLTHIIIWARDQDEAKAFYTEKLGFEVGTDLTLDQYGGMRWLTVRAPDGTEIVLADPGSAAFRGPEAPDQIREMLAKGLMGSGIFSVDDCRATYAELSSRGVEFTEEPTEHFYGVDAAFRDPSGNQWRMSQPAEVPATP
jgi:catechol 2,3-dioxygenase-like lactoylglutathione lyase family enzyme